MVTKAYLFRVHLTPNHLRSVMEEGLVRRDWEDLQSSRSHAIRKDIFSDYFIVDSLGVANIGFSETKITLPVLYTLVRTEARDFARKRVAVDRFYANVSGVVVFPTGSS